MFIVYYFIVSFAFVFTIASLIGKSVGDLIDLRNSEELGINFWSSYMFITIALTVVLTFLPKKFLYLFESSQKNITPESKHISKNGDESARV